MNDDELQAIFTAAYRKQRRDAVLLIIVSSVFILTGLVLIIGQALMLGLFVMIFFAAGIVAGIMELVGRDTRRGLLSGIIGALLMTLSCGLLVTLTVAGVIIDAPGRSQAIAAIAAGVGVVFFGGGAVLLIIRYVRRH